MHSVVISTACSFRQQTSSRLLDVLCSFQMFFYIKGVCVEVHDGIDSWNFPGIPAGLGNKLSQYNFPQ